MAESASPSLADAGTENRLVTLGLSCAITWTPFRMTTFFKGDDRERPQCAQAHLWHCKARARCWGVPKAFSLARFLFGDHIVFFSLHSCGFGRESQAA